MPRTKIIRPKPVNLNELLALIGFDSVTKLAGHLKLIKMF